MEDPKEKLMKRISTPEMERRWTAVREMMKEKKIDYLVIQNSEEFLGGTVRWFTDFTARHQFPMTVIFPVDDEMTVINCGNEPPAEQAFPPPYAARGIKNRLGGVYFSTLQYTNTVDAEIAVNVLKEKTKPTIGLVEKSFIPITFYEYLVKHLPDANFVDATEWIDEIRVIKSPEEIELIKGTAALQDAGMEKLKEIIKPGMRDCDVYAEAHCFLSKNGSQRGLVLVGSGPMGTPVGPDIYHFQNRVIKEGDQVIVLIEVNGPGGYYTETARTFFVGRKPSQTSQDAFGISVEAMEMIVENMIPGAEPKDLFHLYRDFIKKKGYFPAARAFGHGQGLSLVDRPCLWHNEPWKLKAGMNMAIHPPALRQDGAGFVCNNFMINENGTEELHKFPKELVVI